MMRAHQPGSQPIDIPETIPNPVVPQPVRVPSPAPKPPVKIPTPQNVAGWRENGPSVGPDEYFEFGGRLPLVPQA
jgi:hypothetical protein